MMITSFQELKKNYMLEWLKASVKTGNDHQKLNVNLRHIPFNLILSSLPFSPKSPLSLIFLVRFLETLILPKSNYNLGVFSYPPEAIAKVRPYAKITRNSKTGFTEFELAGSKVLLHFLDAQEF